MDCLGGKPQIEFAQAIFLAKMQIGLLFPVNRLLVTSICCINIESNKAPFPFSPDNCSVISSSLRPLLLSLEGVCPPYGVTYVTSLFALIFSHSWTQLVHEVWSLTQFYSVDFSQSMIGVNKCVFYNQGLRQLLVTVSWDLLA